MEPNPETQTPSQQPPTTVVAACAKSTVFSNPILLEAVLLNLSMQELLLSALLVSHNFHDAITSSPLLQQHLFFSPAPSTPQSKPNPVKNPLLAAKFPPFFRDFRVKFRTWPIGCHRRASDFTPAQPLHPFNYFRFETIRSLEDTLDPAVAKRRRRLRPPPPKYTDENCAWAQNPPAFSRADASWRKMLVTQPAAEQVVVVRAKLVVTPIEMWQRTRETVRFDGLGAGGCAGRKGLRMGWLYDHVAVEIDRYNTFGVQWNMFVVEEDAEVTEPLDVDNPIDAEIFVDKEEVDGLTVIWKRTFAIDPPEEGGRRDGDFLSDRFKSKAKVCSE